MSNVSEWESGTLNHQAMWGFYSVVNYLGAAMCTALMAVILHSKHKTAGDILIVLLCSGCLAMSYPCATQCTLNWASGTNRFQYGWMACNLEAFFHVSAIMVQFYAIALIAVHHDREVTRRRKMSKTDAWRWCVLIWTVGEGTTFTFGRFSEVVLMPAGAYCFYDPGSKLIVWWFMPTMLIALGVVCRSYFHIFWVANQPGRALTQLGTFTNALQDQRLAAARLTFLFPVLFFFGWFPAVIMTLHTVITGQRSEYLDLVLAVCGSIHSVSVPVAYGVTNPRFQRSLAHLPIFHLCIKGYKLRPGKSGVTVTPDWQIPSMDFKSTTRIVTSIPNSSRGRAGKRPTLTLDSPVTEQQVLQVPGVVVD